MWFLTYPYTEMLTTEKLTHPSSHIVTSVCVCVCVCVCGENTQDLLLANFKFSIINYNFDIVHNSPRTFTSYN